MVRRLILSAATAVTAAMAAVVSVAAPAAAQIRVAPPPTGSTSTVPYNRTRALADARQWDEALRRALTGPAQDKLYVLLAFMDGSANDAERPSGQRIIWHNMDIFEGALSVASPEQRRRLEALRTSYNRQLYNLYVQYESYGRRYGHTPPPYTPPHTAGECRRRGGTVTSRQTCEW